LNLENLFLPVSWGLINFGLNKPKFHLLTSPLTPCLYNHSPLYSALTPPFRSGAAFLYVLSRQIVRYCAVLSDGLRNPQRSRMEMATSRGKSGRANETILSSGVFKEKERKGMLPRLSPFRGTRRKEIDVKKRVIEVDDLLWLGDVLSLVHFPFLKCPFFLPSKLRNFLYQWYLTQCL